VVIVYGTNDAGSAYSSTFEDALDTILADLITGGVSATDITVCSLPYCTDTTSRPLVRQQAYADACEAAALTAGVNFADVFTLTKDTPSYISGDTIHPTNAGHAAMATTIEAAM